MIKFDVLADIDISGLQPKEQIRSVTKRPGIIQK
jgi:hypothetical protein